MKEQERVPRFALTLTDLESTVQVSVGSDDLRAFWKPVKKKDYLEGADNSCELTRLFSIFVRDIASKEVDKRKAWEAHEKLIAKESAKAIKRSSKRRGK